MSKIATIFAFAVGAAAGSAVTWKLLKTKYERIAQEEIDSVKEVYSNKYKEETQGENIACPDTTPETDSETVERIEAAANNARYSDMVNELGYSTESEEGGNLMKGSISEPQVISPEEFSENDDDYEVETLTYYADGTLTDEYGNVVEDKEDLIGPDALDGFNDEDTDSVYVKNDVERKYYEILQDMREYDDA